MRGREGGERGRRERKEREGKYDIHISGLEHTHTCIVA